MSTVFEKIIAGKIPGNFVWADDRCVVFMTIEPIEEGHVLVVPREPIDKWTDLPPTLLDHLFRVAQIVGKAQEHAFGVPRAAVIIAGFEVPHAHIHVVPAANEEATELPRAHAASAQELQDAANSLRDTLRNSGYEKHVPLEVHSPAVG